MNPEELKQNIAIFYAKLPPTVQSMFASMSWLETLKRISIKYNLTEAQIQTLGTEATLVLLGIISTEEFESNLKKEISLLAKDAFGNMLEEINSLVINPIKTELNNTFKANSQNPEPELETQGLDERFANLAKNVQDAISKLDYQNIIYTISKDNKLNVEQTGILEVVTVDVITGVIQPTQFEQALKDKLKIPTELIPKLVTDVNEKIIKKIRENMMNASSENKTPASAPTAAPAKTVIPDPASTVHTLKDDMQTLKKAGIELMPDVKNAPNAHNVVPIPRPSPIMPNAPIPTPPPRVAQQPAAPNPANNIDREEMLKQEWHLASGGPTPPKSIEAQKFAGTFQIPKTQTDYAMKNISKVATPAPALNKDPKSGTDPYREVIE